MQHIEGSAETIPCEFSQRVFSTLESNGILPYSTFQAPRLNESASGSNHPVSVFVVEDPQQVSTICKILEEHSGPCFECMSVIGFDTETHVGRFKRPIQLDDDFRIGCHSKIPSFIQLAVSEYIVFIFQTYVMTMVDGVFRPGQLSPLKPLLESQHVLKVGVSASRDMSDLTIFFDFSVNNVHDLDVTARSMGLPKHSLAALTYMYCNHHCLSKMKMLVFSNFDHKRCDLDVVAVNYAARDALFGLKVYKQMISKEPEVPHTFPDFQKIAPEEYRNSL